MCPSNSGSCDTHFLGQQIQTPGLGTPGLTSVAHTQSGLTLSYTISFSGPEPWFLD